MITKIKAQFEKEPHNINTAHIIVELCAIRIGIASFDECFVQKLVK